MERNAPAVSQSGGDRKSGGVNERLFVVVAVTRRSFGEKAKKAERRIKMMKRIDRIFGSLLVVGAAGHTAGTIMSTQPMSGIFIWSLGSALAAALLGTLNIVRAGRPEDKTLAAITLIGTACWVPLALSFGVSIGNLFDARAMFHAIVAIALTIFSGMTLWGYSASEQRVNPSTAA